MRTTTEYCHTARLSFSCEVSAVEDWEVALAALARDMACLAATTEEPEIARRLIEMADEVRALAARAAADSPIYDSATFFLHRVRIDKVADPYAESSSAYPTQRC